MEHFLNHQKKMLIGRRGRGETIVTGLLLTSLVRIIAKSVMYYSFAHEIWSDLEKRFGTSTSTQMYSLHEELPKLSQENNMSIAE